MKPSATKCRRLGCEHLKKTKIDTVNGPRMSSYCDITTRVPGNMAKCPLEGEQ